MYFNDLRFTVVLLLQIETESCTASIFIGNWGNWIGFHAWNSLGWLNFLNENLKRRTDTLMQRKFFFKRILQRVQHSTRKYFYRTLIDQICCYVHSLLCGWSKTTPTVYIKKKSISLPPFKHPPMEFTRYTSISVQSIFSRGPAATEQSYKMFFREPLTISWKIQSAINRRKDQFDRVDKNRIWILFLRWVFSVIKCEKKIFFFWNKNFVNEILNWKW